MNTLNRLLLACVLLMSFAIAGFAEELTIPGSGNPEYVLDELAKAFNAQQSKHHVTIPSSSGTAGALREVEEGTATLGRVGRPLKPAERERGLSYTALGRDAVVFVAGAGVTIKNVTRDQVVAAYVGKVTDWRELGGKPGPIRAIGREPTDASRQVIDRAIAGFANIQFSDGVKTVHLDPHLIELLDRYPTSLGFLNRSALEAARSKLAILSLDGIAPTPENLKSGRYSLWLEFGLIYKPGALTDAGRAFLRFVQSPEGRRILQDHGVLPDSASR
ncbi:MAG: substrate-binding domain-containing protein [Rhodocyclaceae bacterium]